VAARSEDLYLGEGRVIEFPRRQARTAARPTPAHFRRRRFAASVAAMFLSVTVFLLATGPEGNALASRSDAPRAVTLGPGQTLWEIAERYAAPGHDLRAYVDGLIEMNGLGPIPQVGERLKLPR
jgi:hypothetical protein